ncbi:MAG: helix-turn-helix transcriptional regulator [Mangrovibacterium sp.]
MKILYLEEHLACSNYVTDLYSGFSFYRFKDGEEFRIEQRNLHYILFFLDGVVELYCNEFNKRSYVGNTMVFFSKENLITGLVKSPAEFVLLTFNNHRITSCKKMSLETICKQVQVKPCDYSGLPIREPVLKVLESVRFYLGHWLRCIHLFDVKLYEVLFTLIIFYTKEELGRFFAPFLSGNIDFKDFVLDNYRKVKTVEELADLHHLSVRSFSRKFKKYFGDSPYRWMLEQKSRHIKVKLMDHSVFLNDIIEEYGFSSPSHFSFYCKKHFGKSPREFRSSQED